MTPEGQIIVAYQGTTGGTNLLFHPLIALSQIFTDMRAFRIYDGPSEVHRWSMARKLVHQAEKAEAEDRS